MRIVIIGPVYPFRGGIAYFTGCLYRELVSQSHQTLLINFKNQYPPLIFPGKSQTERDSSFTDIPSVRILTPYNPFTFKKTLQKIWSFKPNLVCFSFFLPFFIPAYKYLIKRLKKRKIRTMILAHNIEFHEHWAFGKLFAGKLLKASDLILTLSETVYQEALNLVGKSATRVIKGFHPLYEFHNHHLYTKEKAKETLGLQEKRIILFFGYIKPYKGVDLLIKSFPLLKKKIPEAALLIVGEIYGNRKFYKELIEQTGEGKDIMLIDEYIGSTDVELYFKAADVLVLPYRQATQSGVLQTAYVMDLGVVVSPVGSLPDMILPKKTGVVAKSLSEEDLANAIEHFFTLDTSTIKQNIHEYRTNYSWEKLVPLMVDNS